jgi:site-specific DNA-methyltransferase (cytosine-N4-specific)
MQLDLFSVLEAYKGSGASSASLSNATLYQRLSERTGIALEQFNDRTPIGVSGDQHSPIKRRIRWFQQSLRQLGLLSHDADSGRGNWRLTPKGERHLTPATPRTVLVGFSTLLGLALWASCEDVFQHIDEPIHLVLSSPPYPLRQPRAYGNPSEQEYVDWLCTKLEPIVRHLVPGGNIALNVSNDIFLPGMPARSLYQERMVLAFAERLGLWKMDTLLWHCPNKAPAPLQWASRSRQQLNVSWEPIFWFTNDPTRCRADNRRVLEPHTERHQRLLARGGEQRTASYGDGAYRLRAGSFAQTTAGRIPRNLITQGNRCPQTDRLRAAAKAAGLPSHGATMPLALCRKLVKFLSQEGDLVVDPFSGWFKTAKAAEECGRRWIGTELMGEYLLGAAIGFEEHDGFARHGDLA